MHWIDRWRCGVAPSRIIPYTGPLDACPIFSHHLERIIEVDTDLLKRDMLAASTSRLKVAIPLDIEVVRLFSKIHNVQARSERRLEFNHHGWMIGNPSESTFAFAIVAPKVSARSLLLLRYRATTSEQMHALLSIIAEYALENGYDSSVLARASAHPRRIRCHGDKTDDATDYGRLIEPAGIQEEAVSNSMLGVELFGDQADPIDFRNVQIGIYSSPLAGGAR